MSQSQRMNDSTMYEIRVQRSNNTAWACCSTLLERAFNEPHRWNARSVRCGIISFLGCPNPFSVNRKCCSNRSHSNMTIARKLPWQITFESLLRSEISIHWNRLSRLNDGRERRDVHQRTRTIRSVLANMSFSGGIVTLPPLFTKQGGVMV